MEVARFGLWASILTEWSAINFSFPDALSKEEETKPLLLERKGFRKGYTGIWCKILI